MPQQLNSGILKAYKLPKVCGMQCQAIQAPQ